MSENSKFQITSGCICNKIVRLRVKDKVTGTESTVQLSGYDTLSEAVEYVLNNKLTAALYGGA